MLLAEIYRQFLIIITGSGYVKKIGSAVGSVQEGDAVLLSFSYCGECHVCKTGMTGFIYA